MKRVIFAVLLVMWVGVAVAGQPSITAYATEDWSGDTGMGELKFYVADVPPVKETLRVRGLIFNAVSCERGVCYEMPATPGEVQIELITKDGKKWGAFWYPID